MTISIDRAGRLVVPKPLRSALGLRAGSELRVWTEAGRLVLEPVAEAPLVREHGAFLVFDAPADEGYLDHRDLREERIGRLLGSDS